jgi:hypothetical protein
VIFVGQHAQRSGAAKFVLARDLSRVYVATKGPL